MSLPPGRPCFPHLHLKQRLPALLLAELAYELGLSATNEMDMWEAVDAAEWGNTLPVLHIAVLHPHIHAVATPVAPPPQQPPASAAASSTAAAGGVATAASSSSTPSASALLPASAPLTPAAAALRLHSVVARLTAECKPLLSRGGKGTLRFTLSPTPAILPRQMALYPPGAPLSHPFYLHISVPGPLGAQILPALSGPHQLCAPLAKGSAAAGASGGIVAVSSTNASGTVSTEKLSYVMGEHGVHHAFFVPLDHSVAAGKKPPSVYSLPVGPGGGGGGNHLSAPPAFIRFKEILGVNLGGRIWDCGLLLFAWLREVILRDEPLFFHGHRILEVGSGTGLVGVWLWAYVLLKNRQIAAQQAAARPGVKPAPRPAAMTEFLLTDQEEAMDNLRENIATNLALLTNGASTMDSVRIEASRLSWGDESDHAELAIQPTQARPFDLIIASDVVFNPIYFDPLLDSLDYASGPRTRVLLAYRPRASDRKQDEVFFRSLPARGWTVKREAKYEDVFMLALTRMEGFGGGKKGGDHAEEERQQQAATTTAEKISAESTTAAENSSAPATATVPAASSSPADATVESAAPSAVSSPDAAADSARAATASSSPSSSAAVAAVAADSSPPVSPAAFDVLSSVLSLHASDVLSGSAAGRAAGLAQALADASSTGAARGAAMAGELGLYAGFVGACAAIAAKHPEAFNARVSARVNKLRAALQALPLVSSGFDPRQLDDGAEIVRLRTQFKLLLAQMGLAHLFVTADSSQGGQSISF